MADAWMSLMRAGWDEVKAVELAVAIEELGAWTYRALAARWGRSGELRALFGELGEDEAAHGETVRALLGDARAVGGGPLDEQSLKAIARGFFVADDGWALAGVAELERPDEVLEKVLKFERATLNFYRGLRDVLGSTPALELMIAEERRHVAAITRRVGGGSSGKDALGSAA
jgi:rubrerythrin